MKRTLLIGMLLMWTLALKAQAIEIGMQTNLGPAYSSFRGDLQELVGFSEVEISDADVDRAFDQFDIGAPRWVKELFPGLRIELADREVAKQMTRSVKSVRVFARVYFIGLSFTVSDPRLTEPLESRKLGNQLKAVRLSVAGNAEGLAEHLAVVALADATRVDPFFRNRYDLEAFLHLDQLLLPDRTLLEWGEQGRLTAELATGLRFTADPSPVIDLGNVLFVRDRIDELLEGGLLSSVEGVTDEIAEAIQNVVFGKFRDPRVVPSFGWLGRAEALASFGGGFSVALGLELSLQKHVAVSGTRPMFSTYGYLGGRWNIWKKE